MAYLPTNGFIKTPNNSTTSTLTAGSTYTGTSENVSAYNQIHVTIYQEPNVVPNGDANPAQGSLFMEFNENGTDWAPSVPFVIRNGLAVPQTFITTGQANFRVRYINDGGAAAISALGLSETADTARDQTKFILTTSFNWSGTKELGRTLDQSISGTDPVSLGRNAIMGELQKTPGTYINGQMTADRELLTSTSESEDNVNVSLTRNSISATAYSILVDLSDTTNFPHENTGRIDFSALKIVIDPANNSVGSLKIGVITAIDGTDADISYLFAVPFGKSPARILSINSFSPSQLKFGVTSGSLDFAITDDSDSANTAVNTGVSLNSPRGATTVTPAVGDIIVRYTHTSGSAWDTLVEGFYHSHS